LTSPKLTPRQGQVVFRRNMIGMKERVTMKKVFFFSLFLFVLLACDMSMQVGSAPTPSPQPDNPLTVETMTPIPANLAASPVPATAVPTEPPASFEGVEVAVDPLHVTLPSGLASGASGMQFPRAKGEDVAPSEITPGHVQLKLEGYPLQDRFHQPQIYVYPAQAYAEMVPGAFESIHRLDNILYAPGGLAINDQLPFVPFFNAQPVFTSNAKILPFQNGQGVRFLTEYAQYFAPVNNHDMFYLYQGLTNDGAYYVIAILPIAVPLIAESSDPAAALPNGIVPYPDVNDPNADWPLYYRSVTEVLNATPAEAFTPTLDQLDALIGSMRIGQ
jgi:hypothetical protein